jgi:hypothetical protein
MIRRGRLRVGKAKQKRPIRPCVKVLDFGLAQREGHFGGVESIPLGTLG